MTIASEISRLQTAKADIKTAIEGKGVTVPSSAKLDTYDDYISQIEQKGYYGPYPYGGLDYSAMQGPCPNGFHVPTKAEWDNIHTIGQALGAWSSKGATNFSRYLLLPLMGCRDQQTSDVSYQGTRGYYWTCNSYKPTGATITTQSYKLLVSTSASGYIDTQTGTTEGCGIRPFKNTSIIPDSSWTALYAGDARGDGTNRYTPGIFWNSSLGLISISSNGKTTDPSVWVTISDKNVGATTVWNYGDSLNANNCGGYFQWGNNYMFPYTGSVTTSSTKIQDVSSYGPGNYYNSSTFIIGSQGGWMVVMNGDLRGGETGIQSKGEYVIINNKDYIHRYYTFTVSWTETKDGQTTNDSLIYSDDAQYLIPGSDKFDEFFGYSLVRLNNNGEETVEVTQSQSGGFGLLDVSQFSNITSGDNIMVKFPCRGIRMTRSGNVVTLSITNQKDKPGYQYYAFTRGTNIKDNLYLGMYKSSNISNVFKSLSGQSLASDTFSNSRTKSRANNSTISDGSNGWDMMSLYQFMYLRALYTMKYGRPMYNTIISAGKAGSYTTGDSNSIILATGATSTDSSGNTKLFGLENLSHGPKQFIDGLHYYDINGLTYISTNNILTNAIGEGCFNETITLPKGLGNYGGYISEIFGTNKGMFLRSVSTNSTSTSSYGNIGANIPGTISTTYNSHVGVVGGETGRGETWASIFSLKPVYTGGTSGSNSRYTSRLMFL